MSDPAGPVQFSLGDLGGPFGKFSDHSERWTKRTTKTAWSSPEAQWISIVDDTRITGVRNLRSARDHFFRKYQL